VSLGFGINASGYSHAVMWGKGTTTDLGTLGSTQSAAYAINDNGQIVASGSNDQGQEHAFLLTELVSAPRIYRLPA